MQQAQSCRTEIQVPQKQLLFVIPHVKVPHTKCSSRIIFSAAQRNNRLVLHLDVSESPILAYYRLRIKYAQKYSIALLWVNKIKQKH